jgi:hypothetical protein
MRIVAIAMVGGDEHQSDRFGGSDGVIALR